MTNIFFLNLCLLNAFRGIKFVIFSSLFLFFSLGVGGDL